jgi:hypothetical protein
VLLHIGRCHMIDLMCNDFPAHERYGLPCADRSGISLRFGRARERRLPHTNGRHVGQLVLTSRRTASSELPVFVFGVDGLADHV